MFRYNLRSRPQPFTADYPNMILTPLRFFSLTYVYPLLPETSRNMRPLGCAARCALGPRWAGEGCGPPAAAGRLGAGRSKVHGPPRGTNLLAGRRVARLGGLCPWGGRAPWSVRPLDAPRRPGVRTPRLPTAAQARTSPRTLGVSCSLKSRAEGGIHMSEKKNAGE
jgi:hypothetical protein